MQLEEVSTRRFNSRTDGWAFPPLFRNSFSAYIICAFILLLVLSLAGCGVTEGPGLPAQFPTAHTQLWLQQFGANPLNTSFKVLGFGAEAIAGVATDPSGNVIGGGYVAGDLPGSTSNGGEADAYLIKLNSSGQLVWARQYNSGSASFVTSVATDPSGNIIAGGATVVKGQIVPTAVVFKTDPAGNLVWLDSLPAIGISTLGQVAKADADGNVFIAGLAYIGGNAPEVLFMAKLSGNDGSVIWYTYFPTTSLAPVSGLAIDPSGDVLVAGAAVGPGASFVAKVQGTDGSLVWARQLPNKGTLMNALAIASDGAGNAIIGGGNDNSTFYTGFSVTKGEEGFVAKLNAADGSQAWNAPISTGQGEVVTSVQVAADGTILAAGLTNYLLAKDFTNPPQNIFVAKLGSDASHISAQQIGTGPLVGSSSFFGPQTALDSSGNLFVSGATTGSYPGFTNTSGEIQMFIAKFGPQ